MVVAFKNIPFISWFVVENELLISRPIISRYCGPKIFCHVCHLQLNCNVKEYISKVGITWSESPRWEYTNGSALGFVSDNTKNLLLLVLQLICTQSKNEKTTT